MTSLPITTTHDEHARAGDARIQLRQAVGRSAARGALRSCLGAVLLGAASFLFGVFLLGVVDVLFDLGAVLRIVVLLTVVLMALAVAFGIGLRAWLNRRRALMTAQHIERAAGVSDQPIVRGLSMLEQQSDPLTERLGRRAEQRAAQLAEAVRPGRAYPLSALTRQGRWLWLACVGWLVFGIVFPTQLLAVVQRALLPWADTPAFTLTQLEPTWTPAPPKHGDDVTVSVVPQGMATDRVDLLRLDGQGDVAERITMMRAEPGGFDHTFRRVDQPITFRLESHGRATRAFTITPTPNPPEDEPAQTEANDPNANQGTGGQTNYDPDAVKQRDAAAKWAEVRDAIESLLAELAELEELAQSIDPQDAQALKELAERIAGLNARAEALAGELNAIESDLPADAAASLSALQNALENMQTAKLPIATGSASGENGSDVQDPRQTPGPADWLQQAERAANADQQQISQGLGQSDVPTDSGSVGGEPGEDVPIFRDPEAVGGYDEQGVNGDDGPLPPAVMQQVPPSYRPLINAYFSPAGESDNAGNTSTDSEDTP